MKRTDNVANHFWKRLFFTLLIINLIAILLILILIFFPVSQSAPHLPEIHETEEKEGSEFIVRTTKRNLNELINAYLNKQLKYTDHRYHIVLDEDVQLLGELPVFSSTVPLFINFEPIVQKNGDLVLKLKSMSVGLLELPNKRIMGYVKKYLPMPEWVQVYPKEEEVYVSLTNMDIKSNFKVSMERFDLDANNIAIKIKVPYETLGIDLNED